MPGCFLFFLLVMHILHSIRGVAYVKGDEIILVIIYHIRVFSELSVWRERRGAGVDSENAPLTLTFDSNACISTSVFILRDTFDSTRCIHMLVLF